MTLSHWTQGLIDKNYEEIIFLIHDNKIDLAVESLKKMHYADLADILDNMDSKLYSLILPSLVGNLHPETLSCVNNSKKQSIVDNLGIEEASKLINELDLEDSIEIIENLNSDTRSLILDNILVENKQKILEGFNYPEDSVGRYIEKKFVVLKETWTVEQAIDHIKSLQVDMDMLYIAVVVNNKYQPVGTINVGILILYDKAQKLVTLISPLLQSVDSITNMEHVIFLFKQYSLNLLPVINKSGKLIGVISIHNIVHLVEEYTESKFMHIGGVRDFNVFANIYSSIKQRFPWLFVNLISAYVTTLIISQFTYSISKQVVLAIIMPIVASMGGNVGSQAMTIHIRALSNRELVNINMGRSLAKEMIICIINGIFLAFIGATVIFLFIDNNFRLSSIFFFAVIINFIFAGLLGTGIPMILNRLSIDPAAASGVIVTGLTDAFGFFSFLSLAYIFLV